MHVVWVCEQESTACKKRDVYVHIFHIGFAAYRTSRIRITTSVRVGIGVEVGVGGIRRVRIIVNIAQFRQILTMMTTGFGVGFISLADDLFIGR